MRPVVAVDRPASSATAASTLSWFAADRVMACMESTTAAADVLCAAARLSSELHAVWYAVYVSIPQPDERCDAAIASAALSDNIALAEHLGAVVVRITADDQTDGLLAFAHREGVTHVVFGDDPSPAPPRVRTIAARLKDEVHGATLVAVPLTRPAGPARFPLSEGSGV
ncbi:MAG TPA: hypothetical protein VKE96_00455 [Vicinamibacterales bacterium]|nr:hypothetical protein [Vicinamibacterales bacterium]